MRILFIPHGGGPLPLLGDPGYARLSATLRSLGDDVAVAKAIIVVTAHWECEGPGLCGDARPGMFYDYYGFPEEAYRISYPAPGAPELARDVAAALKAEGLEPEVDPHRGFDHGVFVPMILLRPQADIPILQMSVLSSLDPAQHLAYGRALAKALREDFVLIGSGFSFHNIGALTGRMDLDVRQGQAYAKAFHEWLDHVICDPGRTDAQRAEALISWAEAPGARFCQPRAEHLMPLHVCAGAALAAGMKATRIFGESVKGYQASGYRWQP
jgi:aromatic ring-opening dioxygenase catalytic subunit (LigB family)